MEHRGDGDARAKPLGIGGNPKGSLCRGLEQDAVDLSLVLIGDVSDGCGQRIDHMEVGYGQKLGLPFREPLPRRAPLTLRAMPIAAAVEGDDRACAGIVLAARDMAAERRGAAALDGAHHFELPEADMAAVGFTPCGAVIAENIRDLQHWPGHSGGLCGHFTLLALRLLWRR